MYKELEYGTDTIKSFADLKGLTLTKVEKAEAFEPGEEGIIFHVDDGRICAMGYKQDCCASCYIEDIAGDLQGLVGSPIVRSEENSDDDTAEHPNRLGDEDSWSCTWTFYRIQTAKGLVVIRWYGESNGYYSEEPSFEQVA